MKNNIINFNFFRGQTLKFKFYFFFSIILSVFLFFLDSISIIAILPVISNFDKINLDNLIYTQYIPEIFFLILQSLNQKIIIIIFITVLFLRNILNIIQNLINFSFDKYLEINASKKILDLYLRKDFLKFYEIQSNDLLKDLRESVIGYCLYIGSFLRLFSELTLISLLISFLFYISFLKTLIISLVFLSIICVYRLFFFKKSEELGKIQNISSSQLNLIIIELNRNFIQVILRKLKNKYLNKYLSILYNYTHSRLFAGFIKSNTKQVLELFVLFLLALVVIFLSNTADLSKYFPTLLIYLVAIYRILPLANNISANLIKIKNFCYSYYIIQKKIDEHNLKYVDFINDQEKAKLNFTSSLKLKNISFRYSKDQKFLFANLNFKIKKNEMIGIIGESGYGKSSLLKIIMGIFQPNRGKLILDNNEIKKNNLYEFQNLFGFLSQENILTNDTLIENVAFGSSKININKVKKSLKLANCKFFTSKLKNNLNYTITEHGKNFSIGQLQRIGLARMLYFNNDIFILDEPTSALDEKSELKFINLIQKFKNNKTIIISTHKKNILRNCDKIYELKNKKLKRIF